MSLTAPAVPPLVRTRWRETAVLMVAAGLVPFLVHLLPSIAGRPAGVYLLPAFWTAFVAVHLYGARLGVMTALVTPAANLVVTGLPAPQWLGEMTLELVVYVVATGWLLRRWPRFWLAAPLAYLPAKALSILVGLLLAARLGGRNPVSHFADSISDGLAGLGILLLINLILVRLSSRDGGWDA